MADEILKFFVWINMLRPSLNHTYNCFSNFTNALVKGAFLIDKCDIQL